MANIFSIFEGENLGSIRVAFAEVETPGGTTQHGHVLRLQSERANPEEELGPEVAGRKILTSEEQLLGV